jgi:lipopolysaccharide/colanic/teichoic acid biosynthesis glycosyltransferase
MLLVFEPSPQENATKTPTSVDLSASFRSPVNGWYVACKLIVEFIAAVLLLVLAMPVILVSALLVRLTSRGPAFYTQTRLGQGGRPYLILKLRSMYHQCEKQSGVRWSAKGDTRITPVGRFIRRTHIDELPQLWNVIRGDMSLIGPRPERPEFAPELERHIPRYRERLLIRPGVTGLAQVQAPADTNLESVRNKLAYDLYYVNRQNIWLDLRILMATALKVTGVPLPVLKTLFMFPSSEIVQDAYRNPAPAPKFIPQVQPV